MASSEWRFGAETILLELVLTEPRREQLAQLDRLYFNDIGEGSILAMTEAAQLSDDEAPFWVKRSSMWTICCDGEARYEAFMYGGDSGSVFEAGTTTLVAEIIQCGLQAYDEVAEAAILEAHAHLDRAKAGNYTLRVRAS